MSGKGQSSEPVKVEREPRVYVYLPDTTDPIVDYSPNCDQLTVLKLLSASYGTGILKTRNTTHGVETLELPAGNYDFHIAKQISQSRQSK